MRVCMHFFPYVRACVCVCVRVCETREGYGPYCSIELLNKCVCVCEREKPGRDMDRTIVLNC